MEEADLRRHIAAPLKREYREALKGVIPSRKTVNPYLDSIIRKLEERLRD